jgi:hypothetical protein
MAETNLVVDHLKFSYEGLFSAAGVYSLISSYFFEKGWDWNEKMNEEQITPDGKQIRLVLMPWKSISDYYVMKVRIKVNMIDLKEVEVKQKEEVLKLDHGLLRITFDGYVMSDRNNQWAKKPLYWFLSIILEKYFFHHHYERIENWVKKDIETLHDRIKSYLNVYKYNYSNK